MQGILRIFSFPISLIYALVVVIRNLMFDWGWFTSTSFSVPTVVIGNLSVGGTGKTPMIEFIIRLLPNLKKAVLSRGYRRKTKGFVLAGNTHGVLDLGDEPYQIFQKFPEISVAVDANRRNGIRKLMDLVKPELILLDDAFQHRKVKPSISILLTTYAKPYVDDWYFPDGNLRDSKLEAKRADVIVVTKCPGPLSEEERMLFVDRLKPKPYQKVLFSWLGYAKKPKSALGSWLEWEDLKSKSVAVVTGIALPEPFLQFLESKDLDFEHLGYLDHHYFTDEQVQKFNSYDLILTTEKDFVRLQGRVDVLYYLEVEHCFSESDTKTLSDVLHKLI